MTNDDRVQGPAPARLRPTRYESHLAALLMIETASTMVTSPPLVHAVMSKRYTPLAVSWFEIVIVWSMYSVPVQPGEAVTSGLVAVLSHTTGPPALKPSPKIEITLLLLGSVTDSVTRDCSSMISPLAMELMAAWIVGTTVGTLYTATAVTPCSTPRH